MLPDHAAWSAALCSGPSGTSRKPAPASASGTTKSAGTNGRSVTTVSVPGWVGSGLGLVTRQILCREGGQAVGAQSIAASCGTQPDFDWITFTLTNLLSTAGIATPTFVDWMARLDSALTILLLLLLLVVVVVDDYLGSARRNDE